MPRFFRNRRNLTGMNRMRPVTVYRICLLSYFRHILYELLEFEPVIAGGLCFIRCNLYLHIWGRIGSY